MTCGKMIIALVDSDFQALRQASETVAQLCPNDDVLQFFFSLEAYMYLKSHRIDVLITECVLPGFDGFELMERALREQPWVRVVFLTERTELAAEAMRRKADDFLVKPVTAQKLRHALDGAGKT